MRLGAWSPVTDEPNGRTPQNIREVGFVVDAIKRDVAALDGKLDRYVRDHQAEHRILSSAVAENTDWRKERQVWERLAKWAIGTNLIAIIGLVLALFAFLDGRV